ncbi:MAG: zinc-binding dehydrogenase [Verrucomicrobia bacterium]|nr:zinc-binding dehydrogenase [Verrucomicrobiota bacterium]
MSSFTVAILSAPGRITFADRPLAPPREGQVRVRLEGCGVCGSNLPVWEGRPWFTYPLAPGAPGHEGWGVVDAVGPEVDGVREGDPVATLSQNAFAEYDLCEVSQIVRLPASLGGRPFPGEALGCAMNVFRRCDIQSHHRVAVVGVGFLGALLIQLAARAGARVYAVARRPFARETARRMGATEVIAMEGHAQVIGRVKELTGDAGCERVIEAAGLQWPLDLAGELTAERGRLIIAGYHQDGTRQVNLQLWNWRGLDVVNAHERDLRIYREGVLAAAEAVAAGRIDPYPLYTHSFALDEVTSALNAMKDRPHGFMKGLVTYV